MVVVSKRSIYQCSVFINQNRWDSFYFKSRGDMFPLAINIVLAKGAFSSVLFSQMLDMRDEFLAITAFGSPEVDDCNGALLDEVLIVFISNLCYTHVSI